MASAVTAAVHYEDQLSSAKKCGHLGGEALVPTQEAKNKLVATRLASKLSLVETGYKFQFITLAGFHALNTSMFELAKAYKERVMVGYSELQDVRLP